ncbi:MAG: hypothetical protein WCW27_04605 [Patescibacteria group bacterium]|jgi:hypothetical protein
MRKKLTFVATTTVVMIISCFVVNAAQATTANYSKVVVDKDGGKKSVIGIDNDNIVHIAYISSEYELKLATCNNNQCKNPTIVTLAENAQNPSMVINLDDSAAFEPLSVVYENLSTQEIKLAGCDDLSCTTFTTKTLANYDQVESAYPTMALTPDGGKPVISYSDSSVLHLILCGDMQCDDYETTTDVDLSSQGNIESARLVVDKNNIPHILLALLTTSAITGTDSLQLWLYNCTDATCSSGNATRISKSEENLRENPSFDYDIILDRTSNPIIAYNSYNTTTKKGKINLVRCADDACANDTNKPIKIVKQIQGLSVALKNNKPMVSYAVRHNNKNNLHLIQCTNLTCSKNTESTIDTQASVGSYCSLQYDKQNKLAVSYYNDKKQLLKLARELKNK